ncbi:MAG TPA: hypothetical protein VFX20_18030 [Steroidobacteraceae bacterium]|nr:hypothetical protein [Steroidobacteraceae bacterium]
MARPKNNDLPTHMWPDGDRGGFIVQNPLTGKRKRFPPEKEQEARDTALVLNQYLETRRQKELLDAGRPRLNEVIDTWEREELPRQPWDESTRATAKWRLERIKRELGKDEALIEDIDCVALGNWLARTAARADPFNKWRRILVLVWGFAVAKGLAPANEAEKVQRRSTSRKIAENRKRRQQLDVEAFKAIHEQAGELLRLAMELSLVTLQARGEVCRMRHDDFRDGWLYIIRDKVAGDSDMAFIRVAITPELEALRARALRLDAIASPFLVHRRPERMQRRWIAGKDHWTCVNPGYLTDLFAEARDKVPRFAELPERDRPPFHEIRGLGGRLMKARLIAGGVRRSDAELAVQQLMTHSNPRTTQIYLEHGREALTDEHFVPVKAAFSVRELLGG